MEINTASNSSCQQTPGDIVESPLIRGPLTERRGKCGITPCKRNPYRKVREACVSGRMPTHLSVRLPLIRGDSQCRKGRKEIVV